MPKYSATQIADAMRQAGFPEVEIPTGVAIALTESSGDSGATNRGSRRVPEYSVGPWQINLNAHGRSITEEAARDLQSATNYAYVLWKDQGWQPWSVYTSGSYKSNLQAGVEAGSVQEQQAVSAARIAQLVQQHGQYTAVEKPGTEKIVPPGYPNTPRIRDLVGIKNPDPIYEVVFADGTKVDVRGERDPNDIDPATGLGRPTGGWIPTGGDTSALKNPTSRTAGGAPAGGLWHDNGDGTRTRLEADPDNPGQLRIARRSDGTAETDYGGKNPPRPRAGRTQAQEDEARAQAALADARRARLGQPTPRTPEQTEADVALAEERRAQTIRAQVEAAAAAQRMLPAQMLALQASLRTIEYIKSEAAAGHITFDEAQHYLDSNAQALESALRGSTPAAEEKARQEQVTRRADIGKDLLNERVRAGTGLAGNLFKDYQTLLSSRAAHGLPTVAPPEGLDLFSYARALTDELGGGPEMSTLARQLLAATNPATGPAVGPSPVLAGALPAAQSGAGAGTGYEERYGSPLSVADQIAAYEAALGQGGEENQE